MHEQAAAQAHPCAPGSGARGRAGAGARRTAPVNCATRCCHLKASSAPYTIIVSAPSFRMRARRTGAAGGGHTVRPAARAPQGAVGGTAMSTENARRHRERAQRPSAATPAGATAARVWRITRRQRAQGCVPFSFFFGGGPPPAGRPPGGRHSASHRRLSAGSGARCAGAAPGSRAPLPPAAAACCSSARTRSASTAGAAAEATAAALRPAAAQAAGHAYSMPGARALPGASACARPAGRPERPADAAQDAPSCPCGGLSPAAAGDGTHGCPVALPCGSEAAAARPRPRPRPPPRPRPRPRPAPAARAGHGPGAAARPGAGSSGSGAACCAAGEACAAVAQPAVAPMAPPCCLEGGTGVLSTSGSSSALPQPAEQAQRLVQKRPAPSMHPCRPCSTSESGKCGAGADAGRARCVGGTLRRTSEVALALEGEAVAVLTVAAQDLRLCLLIVRPLARHPPPASPFPVTTHIGMLERHHTKSAFPVIAACSLPGEARRRGCLQWAASTVRRPPSAPVHLIGLGMGALMWWTQHQVRLRTAGTPSKDERDRRGREEASQSMDAQRLNSTPAHHHGGWGARALQVPCWGAPLPSCWKYGARMEPVPTTRW